MGVLNSSHTLRKHSEQLVDRDGQRHEAIAGPPGNALAGAAAKKAGKSRPESDHGRNKLAPEKRLELIDKVVHIENNEDDKKMQQARKRRRQA